MMRILAVFIVVMAMLHVGQANRTQPRSPLEDELMAVQQAQITANNAADIATLDRLTADEWSGVSASGRVQDKTQFLADVRARGPAKVQRTMEDAAERQMAWRVHVSGTLGLVTRLTAGDHGSRVWNTTVWSKRDGRWQRVFSQSTTSSRE